MKRPCVWLSRSRRLREARKRAALRRVYIENILLRYDFTSQPS